MYAALLDEFDDLEVVAFDLLWELLDFFTWLEPLLDEDLLATCELLPLLLFASLDDLELCG